MGTNRWRLVLMAIEMFKTILEMFLKPSPNVCDIKRLCLLIYYH